MSRDERTDSLWQSAVADRLGLRFAIIQAGMAGGPSTVELVAAVSEAGGLGTIAAGYLSATDLQSAIRAVRARTSAPFAVNVFIPSSQEAMPQVVARSSAWVQMDEAQFPGPMVAAVPTTPAQEVSRFHALLEVLLQEQVPVLSFTFGRLPRAVRAATRDLGVYTIGTATTVREAVLLDEDGVDCIVAQGSEAGGHRGTFLDPGHAAMIGTMALVPQICDRVSVPVIAAGGIMDGRSIAAARALGAQGVQLGTAFLTSLEAGTGDTYRAALEQSTDESTVVTSAFSGKPARAIENAFIRQWKVRENELAPYPIQHDLTRALRQKAAAAGNSDYMSLWAGQGSAGVRRLSARALMEVLVQEMETVLRSLG